jgi:hypothetical protein
LAYCTAALYVFFVSVWLVLWLGWYLVSKMCKCFVHATRHGERHFAFLVIPVECDAKVSISGPIFFNVVVLFQRVDQVLNVFFANVFNAKIINNKCEADWSLLMSPVPWCEFALFVSCFEKLLFKEFLCNDSHLWKSIHASTYLAVYISV